MNPSAIGLRRVVALLSLMMLAGAVFAAGDYVIGVYYFPGWKDRQPYAPSDYPWRPLATYQERKPLLGWYDEGSDAVMKQQIDWMSEYGIRYVVFDWYFGEPKRVYLEHALLSYLRSPNRAKVKFAIMWANHDTLPKQSDDWDTMVRYWVENYFLRPEYSTIDGKPVVFIFSADQLKTRAEAFGATALQLLSRAQAMSREAGLPGIYFVAGTPASTPMIDSYAKATGYSAFSAYNYHQGPSDKVQSHNFDELDRGYRSHWKRFAERANLPLIVPMSSGWDKRPWGGSKDRGHDNSLSTPAEFGRHLEAAKSIMDSGGANIAKMGIICCWNEFGEGSFIEPTQSNGFAYLEQVKRVFGPARP